MAWRRARRDDPSWWVVWGSDFGRAGWGGVGWYPGVSEDRLVQGIHHVVAVFRGGGEVATDSITVLGALLTGQPPGDLLLDLGRSQVSFGLVGGGGHPQVVCEAQYVALAVAENFEQQ